MKLKKSPIPYVFVFKNCSGRRAIMLFVSAGTHDHEEVFTNLLYHCHSSRKFLRHTKSSEVSRKMGHSLAVISVRIHENPSKCGVQLFSQNTKLSISPQECKIFLTKYIFSKSTLLKLQNPVFGFFIRPMVHFLRELNLEVKFSGIEYRGIAVPPPQKKRRKVEDLQKYAL